MYISSKSEKLEVNTLFVTERVNQPEPPGNSSTISDIS
jgi:hypothetical protein